MAIAPARRADAHPDRLVTAGEAAAMPGLSARLPGRSPAGPPANPGSAAGEAGAAPADVPGWIRGSRRPSPTHPIVGAVLPTPVQIGGPRGSSSSGRTG